ncbi:MAG: hypothetical protein JXA44_13985 [Methanospirillaceae archaeon]|nr:hypothetical protein [Methanospirillaceae archaeon]
MYEELGITQPTWQSVSAIIAMIDDDRLPIRNDCPDIVLYADQMLEKVFYNLYDNIIRHAEEVRW